MQTQNQNQIQQHPASAESSGEAKERNTFFKTLVIVLIVAIILLLLWWLWPLIFGTNQQAGKDNSTDIEKKGSTQIVPDQSTQNTYLTANPTTDPVIVTATVDLSELEIDEESIQQLVNNQTQTYLDENLDSLIAQYFIDNPTTVTQTDINYDELDDRYLRITGGTLTGDLTIEGETITEDVIPDGDEEYDLGDEDHWWDRIYVERIETDQIYINGQLLDLDQLTATWGNITGDINNQTDLINLINSQIAASSLWQEVGNGDIYYNSGNVGVGTDTPVYPLDVNGRIGIEGNQVAYYFNDAGELEDSMFFGNGGNSYVGDWIGGNTSMGYNSLLNITDGYRNTAFGENSLTNVTTGDDNVAIGPHTITNLTTGGNNTAVGAYVMTHSSGSNNSALGYGSLQFAVGDHNTAIGRHASYRMTEGQQNVAIGSEAGYNFGVDSSSLTSTQKNVFIGYRTFYSINTSIEGVGNVAVGSDSNCYTGSTSGNTMIGAQTGRQCYTWPGYTGQQNIILGYMSGRNVTSGSNNITIGNNVHLVNGTGSNQLNIGNLIYGNNIDGATTSISSGNIGIGVKNPTLGRFQIAVSSGTGIYIGNTGSGDSILDDSGARLTAAGVWTDTSDETKKKNIQTLTYGLEEVMKLNPVNYQWKLDNSDDIGFIAQEVKKVIPEIVYGQEGNYSMSYSHLTALAIKAIQEQQIQIDEIKIVNIDQDLNIDQHQTDLTTLTTRIDNLELGIEAVELRLDGVELWQEENELSESLKEFQGQLVTIEEDGDYIFEIDGSLKVEKIEAEEAELAKAEVEDLQMGEDASGRETIKAGDTKVTVKTSLAKNKNKIYITPKGKTYSQVLYYDNIDPGESFEVKIEEEVEGDITFDWLVITE